MNQFNNFFDGIGRIVYGIISISLGLIGLTMVGVSLWNIWVSIYEKTMLEKALLDAIGLIVIGMAVFDVAKFLLEEEVLSHTTTKSTAKQRETLLKFLVIIAIAVSLEALVFIFDAGKKDFTMLIYPTFLLISSVLIVVGLGLYQKMTQHMEE